MATKRKASSAAEGAESTLKARRGNLAESAWHAAIVADIDTGDKAAVQATIARLKALQKRGQARRHPSDRGLRGFLPCCIDCSLNIAEQGNVFMCEWGRPSMLHACIEFGRM
jgi:hypothetical protein